MKASKSSGLKPAGLGLCFVALLLVIAAVATLESFQAAPESAAATYSRGTLHMTIPYDLPRAGAGQLAVEVLDPEDQILGHSEWPVEARAGKGSWLEDLRLTKAVGTDDLVWNRLRYRFTYGGQKDSVLENTESISQMLSTPVMHILGQQSYLTGGQAGVRVVVTDSKNETIAGASSVRIELTAPGQQARVLFTGPLNGRGTTQAQFRFPAGLVGTFPVRYVVDTPIGTTEFTQQVRLEDKVSILLTTEKPLYQPGQTIHVRALALDRSNHEAAAGRPLTFEVEDARGNKVFKKATQTSKFGIASAEFALADEVNLGTYHLRALLGDGNTAETALNVERYVLPKFKVAVDFAGTDNPAKHGYRPGDHVTGTIRANYFFGKPVDAAELTVKASAMDVALFEAASVEGKTDRDGAYRFDLKLPAYFAGRPLSQGAARVLIEATVKDATGHAETRGEPITVSESPLIITAVPEGGTLIPNLENQVFILTSYADGKPAAASVRVHSNGNPDQNVTSDEGGVAVIHLTGAPAGNTVTVEASDKEGNRASSTVQLQDRQGADQILLRTERAVYRAGDRIQLGIFSTKKRGTAYVDVVKEGQTVLTRDLDIVDGQATLALTATPDLAGTLDFNAYLFGDDARPVGDHRLAFVQPANELKIEATADAQTYKPGDDARIRLHVTNDRGEGVQAALGLQVVDEAVFALAEKQPGFAKVFFYLEQEVMKPRYEIHSIGLADVVGAAHDRAARALFSATELVNTNRFETEFGRTVPQAKRAAYDQRYLARFQAQSVTLAKSLSRAYTENPSGGDLSKVMAVINGPDVRDAWDTKLRVEPVYAQKQYYILRSAGLDKKFDTGDDLVSYLEVRAGAITGRPDVRPDGIDIDIQHDRGPFNGLAEIVGSVVDPTSAALAGATVTVSDTTTGKSRVATTNAAGQFTLAGVPAGEYEARVNVTGFKVGSSKFTLKARDRAQLSVALNVGSVSDIVRVNGAPQFGQQGQQGRGFGRGGGGGGGRGGAFAGGFVGGNPGALRIEGVDRIMPAAAPMAMRPAAIVVNGTPLLKTESAESAPRVRSYFPEALYINPEIITDQNGRASISIPIADSITTWRMAMLASTTHGALGSGTSSIKVFQDFFVDLDLPVTLTQGDRVSIPVAVYNYAGSRGDVSLQLQQDDWFSLVEDVPTKNLAVDSGRVGGSQFTLEAKRIGKFKLTLSARMSGASKGADIVVREIEVIPNGREQTQVFNGRLDSAVQHEVNFPTASIADASKILVRLYPGPLSQVIEGMDAILRMPGGCFEQTSSSTYPNVLALDYMKRTNKLTPEVHAKAEGYIANGYQRLLTFEVPGGGFSWFGQAPANKILTAYGLMEFNDMSKVYDVDPKLIARTQQWLAGQQQPDGSWKPDTSFINEGATNRYNSDVLRISAYIAWSLENTGYQGPAVAKARQFVEAHMNTKPDAYTLAVLANFAADGDKASDFTRQAMQLLLDARTEKDEQASWTAEETGVYGRGASASVETTALATQALLKWGGASGVAAKSLSYIASKKDASGTWGTTQATIMALRALLLSTGKNGADVRGTLEVSLNGKLVQKLTLTPDNNDLLHQFVLKGINSRNTVDIRFTGTGGLAYQVVGSYFIPWDQKPANEALSIGVTYDRTQLAQDDVAAATATVKNNLNKAANMVMVDLGIPPGFDLLSEDLQTYQETSAGKKSGRLEKFSLTATQAILYFDAIAGGDTVTLHFRLRAKYPIRAKTFASRAYEYYDPEVNTVARPVQLEIRARK
jgi:uncharacterized protein YfaS (alpha-2-macroglobulin family)